MDEAEDEDADEARLKQGEPLLCCFSYFVLVVSFVISNSTQLPHLSCVVVVTS